MVTNIVGSEQAGAAFAEAAECLKVGEPLQILEILR